MKQHKQRRVLRPIRSVKKGEWHGDKMDPEAAYPMTLDDLQERFKIEADHDDTTRVGSDELAAQEAAEHAQRVERYCQREERRRQRLARRPPHAD